jgi:hypothetical protein
MSHTLHRRGNSEDLKRDVIVFCMSAKTVNGDGSAPKKQKFFEIVSKYPYANFGDVKTGSRFNSDWNTVHDNFKDQSVPHFVFTDYDVAANVLKELAEADLGISVVVSGLMDGIVEMCRTSGLKIHTSEHSAGILGKTEKLPDEPILEITTMCGHALVAANLVQEMVRRVKKGKKTVEEAAAELAKPCMCGVFNPKRAEQVLRLLIRE